MVRTHARGGQALCVDERTSLLLDTETGLGRAVGTGTGGGYHAVYLMRNLDPAADLRPGEPLGAYVSGDGCALVVDAAHFD